MIEKTKVTLCEYKGIPVTKREATASDAEVAAELDRARTYAATTIDKDASPAELGDQATIDFIGYINGEPFPGGDGTGYPLQLGSNTFIPGFEDQLVGAKVGETVEVKVPFPENYHEPAYAGKDAVFKVSIKGLRKTVLPEELTDEIVERISPCKTVEEFKGYIKEQIIKFKTDKNLEEKENEALTYLVENSQIEIEDELIQDRAMRLKANLYQQLQSKETSIEDYLDYCNMTMEMFEESTLNNARGMLMGQSVLSAVADAEGFSYTEQDLEREIFEMAMSYRMDIDELKQAMGDEGREMVGQDMLNKQALDFIVANAVEK